MGFRPSNSETVNRFDKCEKQLVNLHISMPIRYILAAETLMIWTLNVSNSLVGPLLLFTGMWNYWLKTSPWSPEQSYRPVSLSCWHYMDACVNNWDGVKPIAISRYATRSPFNIYDKLGSWPWWMVQHLYIKCNYANMRLVPFNLGNGLYPLV